MRADIHARKLLGSTGLAALAGLLSSWLPICGDVPARANHPDFLSGGLLESSIDSSDTPIRDLMVAEALRSGAAVVDRDTDGDRMPDLRVIGDYDGDGNLTFQDVIRGYQEFERPVREDGSLLYDRDGDGSDDRPSLRFRIRPGVFVGTFDDLLMIERGNVIFEGSGRRQTRLVIVAPCTGGPGALDDGDESVDYRYFIMIGEGSNRLVFRDFSFDGGSDRSTWTRLANSDPAECDINDADEDGLGNEVDTQPGGACSLRWCPIDSHYFMYAGLDLDLDGIESGLADLRLLRLDIARVDRTALAGLTNSRGLRISDCSFSEMGEHTAWLAGSDLDLRGNRFSLCGRSKGPCLLLPPTLGPISAVTIRDSDFQDCPGECIGTEIGAYGVNDVSVIDNRFRWSAVASYKTPIRFLSMSDNGLISDLVISRNRIDLPMGVEEAVILLQAVEPSPPITRSEISGNTIRARFGESQLNRHAIALSRATDFLVTRNRVTLDAGNSVPVDGAVTCVECTNGKFSRNEVVVAGTHSRAMSIVLSSALTLDRNRLRFITESTSGNAGIALIGTSDSRLSSNQVRGGEAGIELQLGSSRNLCEENRIVDSAWCVIVRKWEPPSYGNRFETTMCVRTANAIVDESLP